MRLCLPSLFHILISFIEVIYVQWNSPVLSTWISFTDIPSYETTTIVYRTLWSNQNIPLHVFAINAFLSLLAPGSHWFAFCPHSFVFYRIQNKWNHTGIALQLFPWLIWLCIMRFTDVAYIVVHFFLLPNSDPLYGYTTTYLFTC